MKHQHIELPELKERKRDLVIMHILGHLPEIVKFLGIILGILILKHIFF